MNPAERYLRLSSVYCDFLGGLRWSSQDDALEYQDGKTFAMSEEIALFIEGFASGGRLIHFGFLLHLLYLLRQGGRQHPKACSLLRSAFFAAGHPLRNAGAFFATLCRDIPDAVGDVNARDVLARLRNPAKPIRWYVVTFHDTYYPSDYPPLGPGAFEEEMLKRLEPYSGEELEQWFRHGRGPVKEAAKALARALPAPPPMSRGLSALLERPRLAGVRPFVAQMQSVLALPPRRLRQPEMAQGGYADVTTTGQPHLLLPSQFALDQWDFLRRYADRELLYFRREEPHSQARHELIVLLDQGVRTWGDVRLVLGAAALALGRNAARAKQYFTLAATSNGGMPVDPKAVDDETLGQLVEASDLSPNPGLALERVLEEPAKGPRDVVLLTHPRNLQEEDVRTAALRATPPTRLLALSLGQSGEAALSELRHGGVIPVRQFRVDMGLADRPQAEQQLPAPVKQAPLSLAPWRGDVEPVGFPFRFGLDQPVGRDLFDFDYDSHWLLTTSKCGPLYAWSTDPWCQMEVLARPMVDGRLIGNIEVVVGVAGGFVVVGWDHKGRVAAHYDFRKRTCVARALEVPDECQPQRVQWVYSVEHNSILCCLFGLFPRYAVDLNTGAMGIEGTSTLTNEAIHAVEKGKVRACRLLCGDADPKRRADMMQACFLNPRNGDLSLAGVYHWNPFVPLADGLPVLKDCTLLEAQCRGDILAIKTRRKKSTVDATIHLFQGPNGTPLAQYGTNPEFSFVLSSDGKLLARQVAEWEVEVRVAENAGAPLITTQIGSFPRQMDFLLQNDKLVVRSANRRFHFFRWGEGTLKHRQQRISARNFVDAKVQHFIKQESGSEGLFPPWVGPEAPKEGFLRGSGKPAVKAKLPPWLEYDPGRFVRWARATLTVVLDRFDQIMVFDAEQNLVCMFYTMKDKLSGWLPDGTCFGPASSTSSPPTPAVLGKFGSALAKASALGRAKQCK